MLRIEDGFRNRFTGEFENQMYGGNRQWADPGEARHVGQTVARILIERHRVSAEVSDMPTVRVEGATAILADALEVVNYAALPTERRVNILYGVIDMLAQTGILGGRPEWAPIEGAANV